MDRTAIGTSKPYLASRSKIKMRNRGALGLSQLLNNPHAGGMFGDIKMQNALPIMANDEEAIEDSERDSGDREKVHCSDSFPMIAQEHEPSLGGFGISWRAAHPPRDGPFRDIETKQEKFTMNPRRAPSRILCDHSENDVPNFLCESFPAGWLLRPGDQTPIETEACSVPTDHSFRRDKDQRLPPAGPETMNNDPEEFVDAAQSGARVPSP